MRTLGIEFGSWSLKAVEIETRFRRAEVLDFHEVRLPLEMTDPEQCFKEAVAKLMGRLPHHPEKVVTSLPMSQTGLRFFHLPIKQTKKVEQMYRFELEDNVPFKLENAIVEHHITKTKDGSLVAAAIAPKVHIQTHLEWLAAVGVDPDWLTFEGMGVTNLYLRSLAGSGKKKAAETDDSHCVLLLDIGHLKTGVAVLNEDRLEFYRSIPWGGAHISHAIANSLGVTMEEGERRKQQDLNLELSPDTLSGDLQTMAHAAHQSFVPFFTDIQHTLVAFRAQSGRNVDKVLLTGGTSVLSGLTTMLSHRFKKPVEPFTALEKESQGHNLPPTTLARFGEAFGRATVFERKAALLFNFRKGDMAKKTSLTEVSTVLKDPNVVRLLRFAGALALILFLHVTIASNLAKEEAAAADKELGKVFSQTFRNIPKKLRLSLTQSPQALRNYIKQRNKEFDQKLKMFSAERTPMIEIVNAVSQAFPKTVQVDVNTLTLDDRSFVVEGVLHGGELAMVTENLKKIPAFKNVSLNQEGKRFTYRGEIEGR
ncbi:MAG: pilus assembly protein PilM [Bdellovibrionales bacterium]|nr:pilus assembly protein PilM [Bdellovibrionales bacterium]